MNRSGQPSRSSTRTPSGSLEDPFVLPSSSSRAATEKETSQDPGFRQWLQQRSQAALADDPMDERGCLQVHRDHQEQSRLSSLPSEGAQEEAQRQRTRRQDLPEHVLQGNQSDRQPRTQPRPDATEARLGPLEVSAWKFNDCTAALRYHKAGAADNLADAAVPHKQWASYTFPGRRFEHVTSNLSEIANAAPRQHHELPSLQILAAIYDYEMGHFYKRASFAAK
ncbi:hypothetical protein A4X09_0g5828 [Tilletia walkeri]|uniref:Uncharacterized protein n=1 Tax=Tilletia walkeri TaxID=117179 RepID=A0A8X7T2X5_9BASI|nr:hypothetical protein A4X09_0g5828 [Tilletia walkeri]